MKRQRGATNPGKVLPAAETTVVAKVVKKKAKGGGVDLETAVKEVVLEEVAAEEVVAAVLEEVAADWADLCSGVEEEMPWASSWIPFWEMEATGDAYEALYGDVLWDFDIWDLKSIGNVAPFP
ncbi:hypothetical protein ABFS82_05G033300 [Erythranthe guttata]|uniref:uncharacterized protein LOC105966060 n=1 Tax=Erythranthe guttata TaxID=4155 RepID=UPI00064DC2C4|nr:PREDICTED: uncharacterized protein LOC105966060 [Erythranthe guttata]|eukprot:XP_012846055.1 PREDICTED: uncharacterized protein LOC105966060 [Erythranthe guttata]